MLEESKILAPLDTYCLTYTERIREIQRRTTYDGFYGDVVVAWDEGYLFYHCCTDHWNMDLEHDNVIAAVYFLGEGCSMCGFHDKNIDFALHLLEFSK